MQRVSRFKGEKKENNEFTLTSPLLNRYDGGMERETGKPLLAVYTLVYNHESYLHDYFRGILMQKTTFPFVVVIHDDVSTDGSAAIIREYAEKYPDIFIPIFDTENQYSKGGGALERVMARAIDSLGVKYVACCEGDDYWTEPYKLQKQVEYLEAHPDCFMTGCDVHFLTNEGEDTSRVRFSRNRRLSSYEAITKAGYVYTVGMVYRQEMFTPCPESCLECHVGDYPRQILAALRGYIYVFGEKMATYRFAMGNSWSASLQKNINQEQDLKAWQSELDMLDGMNRYSKGRCAALFCWRKALYCRYLKKLRPMMESEIEEMFRRNFAAHYWGDSPSCFRRLYFSLVRRLAMRKAKLRP